MPRLLLQFPLQRQSLSCLPLLAACLLLCACASSPVTDLTGGSDSRLVAIALSGERLHLQPLREEIPRPDSLLALTPAMKAFAERAVYGRKSAGQRAEALHYALLGPTAAGAHGMVYNPGATYSPVEAFAAREANCLGFSLLFVAMARHVGLDAAINDVSIPPAWSMEQDRVQFLRHVNARVHLRGDQGDMVVDLDMDNYRSYYPQTIISDARAKAQYFNNRAMEIYAREQDIESSFYYLQTALQVDGEQGFLWNNLAALYRRAGHVDLAEALYIRALEADPWDLTVIHNLSQLYLETHRPGKATQIQHLVEGYRDRNPYYQYRLASQLYQTEDYSQAAERIESAIRKLPEERVFYQLAADIYGQLGAVDKREQMLKHN